MKKFISISLLFLYLVSSVGVTVSMHYCGGDLAALSLFADPSCCCVDAEEGKKDDCCKNENKSFRITTDQNKVEFSEKKFHTVYQFLPVQHSVSDEEFVYKKLVLAPQALPRSPDNAAEIPAYKRNHSFLFYS